MPDAHMPRLTGEDKSPLALLDAARLHVKLANNLYRFQFVIVTRRSVKLLLGNLFHKRPIRSIYIENQPSIRRPKRFVPILSLEKHVTKPEAIPRVMEEVVAVAARKTP